MVHEGLGFRVQGVGFRSLPWLSWMVHEGLGFGVQGVGFRSLPWLSWMVHEGFLKSLNEISWRHLISSGKQTFEAQVRDQALLSENQSNQVEIFSFLLDGAV